MNVHGSEIKVGDWLVQGTRANQILSVTPSHTGRQGSRIRLGFEDDKYLYIWAGDEHRVLRDPS